jgi:UDP-N-acetylmuramate dehydrogenase
MQGSFYQRKLRQAWSSGFSDEDMSEFSRLQKRLKGRLLLDEPLSRHTSFHIGGPADALALAENTADLAACLDFAREEGLPVFFLAAGTNLLVRDGGIRGLAIKLEGEFKDIVFDGGRVRAGAGANLALLSKKAGEAGLSGLEFAIGIPGTVGGGLVMNAGAHGGELSEVVRRIGFLEEGQVRECPASEAGFGYRTSRFKGGQTLLLWADLELKPGEHSAVQARMAEALLKRQSSQPLAMPNAGCVFKNPASGPSAGALIEACGLKGLRQGGAEVSEMHANFIVNAGGAKAADVLALMQVIRKKVSEDRGVNLENEVLIVGVDQ